MSINLKYNYESVFAPYIEGLINQKKSCGFIYDNQEYGFKKFDDFCIYHKYSNPLITREIAMEWAVQRDTESINFRNQRVSFLRQLSLYMNSLGIESYIPRQQPSAAVNIPYIPDSNDLRELFKVIDEQCLDKKYGNIFLMGYKVLYRLYYCCGLRLSEGLNLLQKDVDLENGILRIIQSKGDKDRLVFMTDDLTEICRKFDYIVSQDNSNRKWFFPGRRDGKPLHKSGVCGKFKQFWKMTECSKYCEKVPTIHSLRHAFVVDRINQWMIEGISLETMMPYLSRYLGHSGIKDTMYYYHQVRKAFQIVRQKDYLSGQIIPEVVIYEG